MHFIDFVSPSPVIQVARQKRKLRINMISMICRISYIACSILCELCDAYPYIYIYIHVSGICVCMCVCMWVRVVVHRSTCIHHITSRHITSDHATSHLHCVTLRLYKHIYAIRHIRSHCIVPHDLYYPILPILHSNFQLHPDTTYTIFLLPPAKHRQHDSS